MNPCSPLIAPAPSTARVATFFLLRLPDLEQVGYAASYTPLNAKKKRTPELTHLAIAFSITPLLIVHTHVY